MEQSQRDKVQQEAEEIWLNSNRRGSLIVGTGVGKSKITIDILRKLVLPKDAKILLLVNSEDLRDKNWKDEFEKWNSMDLWDKVTAECYQTAYKWKDTKWDLVIADEIDFSLTEEYSKFYSNNTFTYILGISGTVTQDKETTYLNKIAPVVYRYSTQDAQEDNILNKTKLILVEFDLSRNRKDITVKYKKAGKEHSFTQSENDAYDYTDKQYRITLGKIEKLKTDPDVLMGIDLKKIKELSSQEYRLKQFIRKRKELLHNSIASKDVAKAVKNQILSVDTNKVLIFSQLTEQSGKIADHTFNGTNKKGNTAIDDISSGVIRELGVCKAVDRGTNMDGLNNIIMESYEGSTTQFQQRHGRGCRLLPGQSLYLYVLLPYFHREVKNKENPTSKKWNRVPTQAVTWAENMMSEFNFKDTQRVRL